MASCCIRIRTGNKWGRPWRLLFHSGPGISLDDLLAAPAVFIVRGLILHFPLNRSCYWTEFACPDI